MGISTQLDKLGFGAGTVGAGQVGVNVGAEPSVADKAIIKGKSLKIFSRMDSETLLAKLGIENEKTQQNLVKTQLGSALEALISKMDLTNAQQAEALRKMGELTGKAETVQHDIRQIEEDLKKLEDELAQLELEIETSKLKSMTDMMSITPEQRKALEEIKAKKAEEKAKIEAKIKELEANLKVKNAELVLIKAELAKCAASLDYKSVAVFAAALRVSAGEVSSFLSLFDDLPDDLKTTELEKFLELLAGEDLLDVILEKTDNLV